MMHMKPADIERRSMEIITGELRERGITLPEENAPVFDFAAESIQPAA